MWNFQRRAFPTFLKQNTFTKASVNRGFFVRNTMADDFLTYKKALLEQINDLYKEGDLFKVICLLENSELDFELCLQLVRTYINVARQSGDPYTLLSKAQTLLDKFSKEGHENAYYQFYQGCILFNQGLINDSLVRFEQALKFVPASDPRLLNNLMIYKQLAIKNQKVANFKGCSEEIEAKILKHYEDNFGGEPTYFAKVGQVKLYVIRPNAEYDFNMMVTVGLSSKNQLNEDNQVEDLELCFPLDKDFQTHDPTEVPFEISMFKEVIENIIYQDKFVGFGYCFENDRSFSKSTAFNGVMLTAIGEYPVEAQSLTLEDKTINFLQMIPLRPLELNFRKQHTALELLEQFENHHVALTPFIKTRIDVCNQIV